MGGKVKGTPRAMALVDAATQYEPLVLRAPRLTGFPLRAFVWLHESPLLGLLVTSVLKKQNNMTQRADDAAHRDPRTTNVLPGVPAAGAGERGCDPRDDRDPVERAEEALQCLAPYDLSRHFASANEKNPFLYWKILDFAHARRSGITTPSAVAEHVIAGVEEWNNKKPPMPMLIYFDAHDLTKQVDASTKRFEQGSPISGSFSPLRMTLTASHIHQRVLPHFSTKSALWRKTQS